jgi:hypothetical protein
LVPEFTVKSIGSHLKGNGLPPPVNGHKAQQG